MIKEVLKAGSGVVYGGLSTLLLVLGVTVIDKLITKPPKPVYPPLTPLGEHKLYLTIYPKAPPEPRVAEWTVSVYGS